ncbi:molybdopterin-guanine dinucleotide biosynthesis protein [Spiractinospora alimapuensis]|uniref:DUF6457 domain-containing protein n=1 Tax=Spiractinospora alimapuensis TaxID=2820884 RepID=UPI001F3ABBC8|nr:DUF6457 domain-containing protein [Spiractinospora alimapuensis]QVQ53950.1 molybdopterin-guanine dinucleotide biosynthesis protein [Spiractinospora alimapuensis]
MTLQEWTQRVNAELGMADELAKDDIDRLLAVARDAAHSVARPAAPLTTYLLGVAVGRGADPVETAELLQRLALAQKDESPDSSTR